MLISLQNITFEFGSRVIVEEVNWQIGSNERIGLIGNNGTGKSTLLKVINGDLKPSSGQVQKAPDLKIAYFHQDLLSFDTEDNILEVAELGSKTYKKLNSSYRFTKIKTLTVLQKKKRWIIVYCYMILNNMGVMK